MIDRVGQHVGNYRLLRLLGQGGFAQVYLGEHRYLKSAAALKVLQRSLTEQETQRFLEEAQTLVRLRHAHIVRVLDFVVERGTPVLIMDYISGGTLRQHHPAGTCLPLAMTVEYVKQIAAALQYAHNQHIIHRDVKPENILLNSDQSLVLSDFGFALFAPSPDLLSTQELAGTLPYTAPEQLRGKPDFASDQYALSVLTYEWLTGVRPFVGSTWELIQQHLTAAPPPLRERCPDLPVTVEQVVLRALAKNPQERYVSVSAFAQALERACRESRQSDDDSQITAPLLADPGSSTPVLDRYRSAIHTPQTIFLSAAPSDELVAARLAADLKRRGLLLSNDFSGHVPDANQEDAMRQAMHAAHRVVVAVTPKTSASRLVREHLRLAQMYQRRIVLVWMQGDQIAAMMRDSTWEQMLPVDVIDARGARYQTALDELLVCLREETQISPYETTPFTAPGEPRDPRNPYKGLRAFHQEDAADFFGRDALIENLMEQLKGMLAPEQRGLTGARLLTLVGSSGSGKSSVVLAGLLPRLQAGALPGSDKWVYLEPIVPGSRPIEALALTLASRFSDRPIKTIRDDLQDDSVRGLHWLATQLVERPDRRVVLVVDQFEEVFTQTIPEEERRCFIDLLVTAATEERGPVLVLLTLRADFYDRPMRYLQLYRLIEAHHQSVLPMDIHDLRAIIEEPAALPDVQLTFEGNLVGDLLFETQGQVGALPLLEFTLDQLFQQRDGQALTMAAYRQMGGVKGALAKHAESTYAALPSEEHRRLARALFLRLIDPGLSEQDTTRRRATLPELSLPDAKQTVLLQEVAEAFIAARLLTTNEIAGTTTIEVSHEALIREWPRLSDWLREGREDIDLQQAISQDVTEWEQRGRPNDRLYRGSQLKEASAWARRNVSSSKEMAFLHASAVYQTRSRGSIAALVLLLVLAVGLIVQIVQTQQASNLTRVTNRNDAGPGSLRQALKAAPAGSAITFAPDVRGTILLTSGNLLLSKDLTIEGPGASTLAISSGSHGFFIEVVQGASVAISGLAFTHSAPKDGRSFLVNLGRLALTNTIISNNRTTGNGGGIYNSGTLTLTNSTVSANTAGGGTDPNSGGRGGGIYNSGTLTLTNTIVSSNTAGGGTGPNSKGRGGGIYSSGPLTLTNSTVSNNTAASVSGAYGEGSGGGIFNSGPLTLTNSTISGNMAADGTGPNSGGRGGGIYNGGPLTLTNSTISDNTAASGPGSHGGGLGGGIYNLFSTLTLTNSTISGNIAASVSGAYGEGSGGGIYNSGPLTLTNSTVSNNTAGGGIGPNSGGRGGGIYNLASTLTLTSSTVSQNRALGGNPSDSKQGTYGRGGGGIYNMGIDQIPNGSSTYTYVYGVLTLTNSTISDNTAGSSGGAISNWGGRMEMTFCTIYGNTAAKGGGLAIFDGYHTPNPDASNPTYQPVSSRVQIRNSLVAADRAPTGPDIAGMITSAGYNLIQDVSGVTFGPSNRPSTDITVGPSTNLKIDSQLSGPEPQTHALLVGSPAIDRIPIETCRLNGVSTDQRGVKRPQGAACDIGAYEYVPGG